MTSPYKTTVVTGATTRDLTTLATVKRDLQITVGTHDAFLTDQIRAGSAAIEIYLNRRLALETVTDLFRIPLMSRAIDVLSLARTPVTAISEIVEAGETLTSDDYEFEADTGFLWRLDGDDRRQCWLRDKISVTYAGGYQLLATLPREIEQACLSIVKRNWYARIRDPLVKREDIPNVMMQEFWVGQVGDNAALTPEAVALLNPHRRIVL